MNEVTFEAALGSRVEEMLGACTQCGKCVEAMLGDQPLPLAVAAPE